MGICTNRTSYRIVCVRIHTHIKYAYAWVKFIKAQSRLISKGLAELLKLYFDVACFLQDRVMINRLDSICQTVLKGKWPSARRGYDANTVASFYTTKLLDSPGAAAEHSEPSVPTPPGAGLKEEHDQSTQMSKVKKHVREKEFTVKIKDVCLFLLPWDLIAIAVCSMLFLQMAACSYSYFLHILVFWYWD